MIQVEAIALGTSIFYPDIVDASGFSLAASDFVDGDNRTIFEIVTEMRSLGKEITPSTIIQNIENKQRHIPNDYIHTLFALADPVVEVINAFKDYCISRQVELLARDIIAQRRSGVAGTELLGFVSKKSSDLEKSLHSSSRPSTLQEALIKLVDDMDNPSTLELSTPWKKVNDRIGSFMLGEVLTIGARPGMGKTQFLVQLGWWFCQHGYPSAYLCTEMSAIMLAKRWLEVTTNIPTRDFRGNRLTDDQRQAVRTQAGETNFAKDNYYLETIGVDPMVILAKVKLLASLNVKCIVIDYIQSCDFSRFKTVDEGMNWLYVNIKSTALKEGVFVIFVSQLTREVEDGKLNYPDAMRFFKGSGAIEAHSDMVWSLWRPSYYGIERDSEGKSYEDITRILGLKGRDGVAFNYVDLFWNSGHFINEKQIVDYEAPY